MSLVLFAMAAALAQTPTDASAPKPAASVTSADAKAAKPTVVKAGGDDEVICRSIAVTGTRFPQRFCMTKATWDSQGQDARDIVNGFQKAGSAGH